jgi:hypothetical protein
VVEHLPGICEALDSILTTTVENEKKKKKFIVLVVTLQKNGWEMRVKK